MIAYQSCRPKPRTRRDFLASLRFLSGSRELNVDAALYVAVKVRARSTGLIPLPSPDPNLARRRDPRPSDTRGEPPKAPLRKFVKAPDYARTNFLRQVLSDSPLYSQSVPNAVALPLRYASCFHGMRIVRGGRGVSLLTAQLREARQLASSNRWRERVCVTCHGRGHAILDVVNSDVTETCANCAGYGVVWYEGDPRTKAGQLYTRELLERLTLRP